MSVEDTDSDTEQRKKLKDLPSPSMTTSAEAFYTVCGSQKCQSKYSKIKAILEISENNLGKENANTLIEEMNRQHTLIRTCRDVV